jgi:hypothetical protein
MGQYPPRKKMAAGRVDDQRTPSTTGTRPGSGSGKAGFRILLAWHVLRGNAPGQVEERFWNRNAERPVLIDIHDWVDERRIFSVLIWPSLESDADDGAYHHIERVDQVKQVIAQGCAEMAWQTRFETDYDLEWDRERECWVSSDGFVYDGEFQFPREPRFAAVNGCRGEGCIANG